MAQKFRVRDHVVNRAHPESGVGVVWSVEADEYSYDNFTYGVCWHCQRDPQGTHDHVLIPFDNYKPLERVEDYAALWKPIYTEANRQQWLRKGEEVNVYPAKSRKYTLRMEGGVSPVWWIVRQDDDSTVPDHSQTFSSPDDVNAVLAALLSM